MAKRKTILLWLLGILLLVFLSSVLLNYVITKKVEKQLSEKLHLKYSNVSSSIWKRNIFIDSLVNNEHKGRLTRLELSKINWLSLFKSRELDFNQVSLSLSEIHYPLKGGMQFIKIDRIRKVGENISMHNVNFSTPYSIDKYMENLPTRKPYISLHFPLLELQQVDIENNHIGIIQTNSFTCKVSEDLNVSINREKKKLLAQIIKDIKLNFRIDSIDLKNGQLEYSMKDRGSQDRGFIDFNDVHITGQSISNDSVAISENQEMIIELSAKIENRAPINVVTKHFMSEANHHFDLYVKLANLNLEHGNDILRSSKGIVVEEGIINSLEVIGNFNDHLSKGQVNIDYEDLKIDLNRKYAGVLNFLSNAAINDKKVDSESFELNRNQEKSFMIHIWQSMMSALRKIILVI